MRIMKISLISAVLLAAVVAQQDFDLPAQDQDNTAVDKYELVGTEHEFRFPSLQAEQAKVDWNYDKHGADWDITSCNLTT
mmetsp:Transcript_6768/g.10886  ORF Transcript_6768/g.10886 Transcript_6768/m.10886 type:complete len:80 (-) Transcript_6768:776-1015(-)